MDVVRALDRDLRARQGVVRTGARVTKLRTSRHPTRGRVCVLETDVPGGLAEVTAERVVLATGTPVLDRGGFFARLEPNRSYAMAFSVPDEALVPTGMYISADSPTRSVRTAPTRAGLRLLVGGNGHAVGRGGDTRKRVADLYTWAREHFPGAEPTHSWSAQDYKTVDGLPYVGRLLPHGDQVLVATGYDKWGMTSAVASALALSSKLLDGEMEWAAGWDPWRIAQVKGAAQAAKLNLAVGAEMAAGYTVRPSLHTANEGSSPAEGEGRVERDGLRPTAVCTVDGVTTRRSATCTHLGGVVRWNAVERSWDCPLHGSRFTADGEVLEGPAVHPLAATHDDPAEEDAPGTA
jgi:Rieske Fe-S protein